MERGELSGADITEGEVEAEGGMVGRELGAAGDGGRWRALGGRGGGELAVLERWGRSEVLWMGEVVKDSPSP